jgi:SnoaL-like domain
MKRLLLGRRDIVKSGAAYGVAGFGAIAALAVTRSSKAADNCNGFPRAEFERYIALFSDNHTDGYGKYYADDVVFERGVQTMHGRDEVLAFYRKVHEHLTQKLQVVNYAATDTFIGAEVHSEFTVFKDFKDDSAGLDMKAGTHFIGYNFVHYDLRDGKMTHIRSAPFKRLTK